MIKFLHTADIHLDSPMLNLAKYDGVPEEEFQSATRRAFENIVDLAIEQEVDFVLIAGDLYDRDCDALNTPLHFREQMQRLEEKSIPVFMINGNHDAANKMEKTAKIKLPANVHAFPVDAPGTKQLDELKVAIHGQGFAQQAVTEDLSEQYPEPIRGYFNIGMLHTSCGEYELHDTYAPSTVGGLDQKNYDYWALGHIHKRDILEGAASPVVYCGNPQGRSVKECGPRGCYIVTVDGSEPQLEFHEVDVVRWVHVQVQADDCESVDDLFGAIDQAIADQRASANDRPLAIRLEFVGTSPVHNALLQNQGYWEEQIRTHVLNQDEMVWIEKVKFKTRSPEEDRFEFETDIGELVERIRNPRLGDEAFADLRSDFKKMLKTIPDDVRIDRDEIDVDRSETVESLIAGAQDLLVAKLARAGGEA